MKTRTHKTTVLAFFALLGVSAQAATVIYSEDFSRTGVLNGLTPTQGAGTWVTGSNAGGLGFEASGTVNTGADAWAYLSFAPQAGLIYTLSATIDTTASSNGSQWIALGFTNNSSASHNPSTNGGQPWLLLREDEGRADAIQTFRGPATGGSASHTAPGAIVDFQIILDTSGPQWTAEWFADGTSLRKEIYTTNPTITHVGLSKNNGAGGFVSNFSLTSIPEPTTGALMIGALGLACLRRRS